MAILIGGKHFGQYTYEHWYDHEYDEQIKIEQLKIKEINSVLELIRKEFKEFVGIDYNEEGNKTFLNHLNYKNILNRYNEDRSQFYVLKINKEIAGMLETKKNEHISLFFIKKEYHGKGFGKKLFEYFLKALKQRSIEKEKITVNSSIFAEKFYEKIGFIKTNELQEKNGIKFIPMEYKASTNVT